MYRRLILLWLISSVAAWCGQPNFCVPASEIRTELQKAQAVPVIDPTDFDHNVAPLLALRRRHTEDLFVHERYQDAVQQHGIEGHLSALAEEYQALWLNHSSDLKYRYLFARSLLGRGTPSAVQTLSEILADHPGFAPAHRTLAEIFASEAFHDPARERAEREKFLALCPGAVLARRPGPLPGLSPLADQAERLLAENGDLDRIADLALQSVRDDEWRLQRIRPFDWYSVEFKRHAQLELQLKYFKVRSLQVRCYRKAGKPAQAAAPLAQMERLALGFRTAPGSTYWDILAALAHLYAEGNQPDQVAQKLGEMKQLLGGHSDPVHEAQLEVIRNEVQHRSQAQ
jgi:hypothetical protein